MQVRRQWWLLYFVFLAVVGVTKGRVTPFARAPPFGAAARMDTTPSPAATVRLAYRPPFF